MMTIWARVKEALSSLGLPVGNNRLFVASDGAKVPDRYLTYQVIVAVPERHVDDEEVIRSYLVQVNAWSRDGFESFPSVEGAMKAAGFYYQASRDMAYEEKTGHYGQSMDFRYYENKE